MSCRMTICNNEYPVYDSLDSRCSSGPSAQKDLCDLSRKRAVCPTSPGGGPSTDGGSRTEDSAITWREKTGPVRALSSLYCARHLSKRLSPLFRCDFPLPHPLANIFSFSPDGKVEIDEIYHSDKYQAEKHNGVACPLKDEAHNHWSHTSPQVSKCRKGRRP